jgi:hypothetical protein
MINSLSYSTIISTWAYAGIYIRYQINGDAAMTQFYRSKQITNISSMPDGIIRIRRDFIFWN